MRMIFPCRMKHFNEGFDGSKRRTNVSLNASLLNAAKMLGVNVSQACEQGLAEQVRNATAEQWRAQNREAIEASNAFVERNGVPLAQFRRF